MSIDKEMAAEMKSLTTETQLLITTFVEIAGWSRLVSLLEGIAETRHEGRIAGVLMAVQRFLDADGE